jgi:hypothetical protein
VFDSGSVGPLLALSRLGEFVPARRRSGVYLLILAGVIVYVGASRNVDTRIRAHLADAAERGPVPAFDCALVIERSETEMWPLERALIYALLPKCNTRVKGIDAAERALLATIGVSIVDEQASLRAVVSSKETYSTAAAHLATAHRRLKAIS